MTLYRCVNDKRKAVAAFITQPGKLVTRCAPILARYVRGCRKSEAINNLRRAGWKVNVVR
jgi:hypothetical protein